MGGTTLPQDDNSSLALRCLLAAIAAIFLVLMVGLFASIAGAVP